MSEAIGAVLIGDIVNLPIHKASVTRKSDASASDTAQGEGYFVKLVACIFHRLSPLFFCDYTTLFRICKYRKARKAVFVKKQVYEKIRSDEKGGEDTD